MGFAPLANLVLVLIVALLGGFTTPDEVFEIEMNTTPRGGILRSLRSALWIGLACATLGGLLMGLLAGPIAGLCVGPLLGLAGASIPANSRATVRNWVLRLVLSRNRYLPARYRPFLDYCTRLVLLRKVGAGYVFVHRYLQEYFACQKDTQTGL
jgi:hypothetical protein